MTMRKKAPEAKAAGGRKCGVARGHPRQPAQLVGKEPVALTGDLKRIAEIAGVEAALKIGHEFRGTHLYIPDVFKKVRDDEIRKAYDGGLSARSLALKHRIAERTVWDILKKPSEP